MTMYKLVLPAGHGEITIGMQYGSVTFKHGQIMPESDIVKLYPQYFFPIPETTQELIVKKIVEPTTQTVKPKKGKTPVKNKLGPNPKKKSTL